MGGMWTSPDPNAGWADLSSSKPEPRNSASCQVYWLGFSSCMNVEGLLNWSRLRPTGLSGRGLSVCKEHTGDPKIAVM